MAKKSPDHAYLLTRIRYDPETGLFTWLPRLVTSSRHKTWNVKFAGRAAGTPTGKGYIQVALDGTIYLAHRLAWFYMTGEWPDPEADHINRIRTDNRWCNLREADESQNSCNASLTRRNTSGVKGVSWDKRCGKWDARIMVRRKIIFLGRFDVDKFDEAARAVAEARALHHQEFANH